VPLAMWAEAAGVPLSSRAVWQESARAEGPRETLDLPQGRNKALKGEAQERGEPKDVPEGTGADAAKRVAKPCRRDFRADWQGRSDARREPSEEKGSGASTC
jgi:hypothetical protein